MIGNPSNNRRKAVEQAQKEARSKDFRIAVEMFRASVARMGS